MGKGLESYRKGCYEKSLQHFLRAYALFSMSDLRAGVAMSLNKLGTVYRVMDEHDKAITAFDEAYQLYMDLDDQKGALESLSNKVAAFIQMNDLDGAEKTLKQAFALAGTNKQPPPLVLLQNKAVLLTRLGRFQEAERILTTCLNASEGSPSMRLASLHFALGNVMLQTNRPTEALRAFEKALCLDKEAGFFPAIADDLSYMTKAHLRLGQKKDAAKAWKRAVKIFALTNRADRVTAILKDLEALAQDTGTDISMIQEFVQRWRQGRLYENPCVE